MEQQQWAKQCELLAHHFHYRYQLKNCKREHFFEWDSHCVAISHYHMQIGSRHGTQIKGKGQSLHKPLPGIVPTHTHTRNNAKGKPY